MGLICGYKSHVPAYIHRQNIQLKSSLCPTTTQPCYLLHSYNPRCSNILLIHTNDCQFFCSEETFLFSAGVKNLGDIPSVHWYMSLLGVLQLARWTTAPILKLMLLELGRRHGSPGDLVPAASICSHELSRGSPEFPDLRLLHCLQQQLGM